METFIPLSHEPLYPMHPHFTKRRAIFTVVLLNLTVLAMHQEVTVKGVVILTMASVGILWVMPQMKEGA